MTNEELHELAAAGVSLHVQAIEQQLASYHKEWPELFLSPTPPQLLKVRNGHGNGHGPRFTKNGDWIAPAAIPLGESEPESRLPLLRVAPVRRRRKMSRKARAAISAAQKARWAKQKAKGKGRLPNG